MYNGVILHAHPFRGEPHNERNATREVATVLTKSYELLHKGNFPLANSEKDRASRRKLFGKLKVLCTLENNLSALAILYASVDTKI